jgi:hypothetical protein
MPSQMARLLVQACVQGEREAKVPSYRAHRLTLPYQLRPEKGNVWSRATAEPTKEPRATNHRPTLFYLIVLCLAEPSDVFKRMETNKRKRTSEKEQTGHTRRCIKGTVRNAVVPLDRCLVELMGVQRPFTLGVTAAAG